MIHGRQLFCDMDGVLVNQTGRERFDLMGWHKDGRSLWAYIAAFHPKLLTALPDASVARCGPEKKAWAARELGPDIEVIIAPDSGGKGRFATPGAVLIDDGEKWCAQWRAAGGIAIKHKSAAETINALKAIT